MTDAMEGLTIRPAAISDAESIAGIYNYYVTNTIVTFEEEAVSPFEIARRIEAVWSSALPWVVAELDSQVVGYAYASKWKTRYGYRFSTEVSVYLDAAHGGRGIGSKLYGTLFPLLKERGIRNIIGGIALPNDASVALHEKFGLEKVAHFKAIGIKFDQWIDVGYWQLRIDA
jgi:L-amino acid N-acyltransferase YncA